MRDVWNLPKKFSGQEENKALTRFLWKSFWWWKQKTKRIW